LINFWASEIRFPADDMLVAIVPKSRNLGAEVTGRPSR